MGKLRFDAAFPISAKSEETELSMKVSGIRHSGQSENGCQRAKRNERIGNKYRNCSERKLGITRRIK